MKKEKITIEEIDRLAELSALEFSEEEKKGLVFQVENILSMLNACQSVDTDKVEYENVHKISDLREDEIGESLPVDEALLNAPKQRKGYFNVPKVVE